MKAMLASLFVCAFACFAPAAESERQVGLFYFLWLGEHGRRGPWDVSTTTIGASRSTATTSLTTNGLCAAT